MTNLKKEDGREINNEDEILAYVHSYYTELYSQPQVQSTAIQEQSEVLSLIDRFVTERENGILLVSPGEAELEDTVKKLPNCKAPGEDGGDSRRPNTKMANGRLQSPVGQKMATAMGKRRYDQSKTMGVEDTKKGILHGRACIKNANVEGTLLPMQNRSRNDPTPFLGMPGDTGTMATAASQGRGCKRQFPDTEQSARNVGRSDLHEETRREPSLYRILHTSIHLEGPECNVLLEQVSINSVGRLT
ncbi:hypothetical protein R1sor_017286 [Riccia sorocarpa]|uniref:Uncharacterized protein n=1 Tax=Riccia sorocarpa TaxID=122646 RepID=A0ABD3I870_9MARC